MASPRASVCAGAAGFALALVAATASAQTAATERGAAPATAALTLYGGARAGGEFDDADDPGRSYPLASGASVAASVDWTLADGQQLQVLASWQRSSLPATAPGSADVDLDVDVGILHLGGRHFFDGSPRDGGGYVAGGIGATFFSPGPAGLSSEVRPSMNLGVGWQWALGPALALRAELRGYLTLVDSQGQFLCSGGCTVSIRGSTLVQAEALLGLSLGF
ncbi:MAG: hypothetical protein MUF03_03425 [Rubrivivax sp.]|nr:hypothetical protein [Rubrivivax sp.]